MRRLVIPLLAVACLALAGSGQTADKPSVRFPTFEMQQIDNSLGVGYAVLLLDLNGDGKKDILVVDQTRVVWYENPTGAAPGGIGQAGKLAVPPGVWQRHVIIEGLTKPDNVCFCAHDINGDGKMDLFLGADWRPFDTAKGGTLQWLEQGKSLDERWKVHPIAEEPMLHRIRMADLDGSGKPVLLVGPMMGRNSTKDKNWMDAPLRLLAYKIPANPAADRWEPEVIDQSLHVMHNFYPVPALSGKGQDILTASYEGVHRLVRTPGLPGQPATWKKIKIGEGNQDNPKSNRGASEIKQGMLASGGRKPPVPYIATIEPWHGNQVVVYTPPDSGEGLWKRQVLDKELKWGHAVWPADIDGDGDEELIIGVRDNLSMKPGERCGVRIYKATDGKGEKWERMLLDEGGVAVEDLAAADLDGDGKIDIVAVGRATKNVRIYWNKGVRP